MTDKRNMSDAQFGVMGQMQVPSTTEAIAETLGLERSYVQTLATRLVSTDRATAHRTRSNAKEYTLNLKGAVDLEYRRAELEELLRQADI